MQNGSADLTFPELRVNCRLCSSSNDAYHFPIITGEFERALNRMRLSADS